MPQTEMSTLSRIVIAIVLAGGAGALLGSALVVVGKAADEMEHIWRPFIIVSIGMGSALGIAAACWVLEGLGKA